MVVKIRISGQTFILGSVYGPNQPNRQFFSGLKKSINKLKANQNTQIIIGGDWNCTWDSSNVELNLDVFNMAAVPNLQNSQSLQQLCATLDLCDPYRILYPNKRDYTYRPFGNLRVNRSRLDFFVISSSLIENICDTTISPIPLCNLFDHCNVRLNIGPNIREKYSVTLSNRFLGEKILELAIQSTTVRTHLLSLNENLTCRLFAINSFF